MEYFKVISLSWVPRIGPWGGEGGGGRSGWKKKEKKKKRKKKKEAGSGHFRLLKFSPLAFPHGGFPLFAISRFSAGLISRQLIEIISGGVGLSWDYSGSFRIRVDSTSFGIFI